jgi:hypothetical protein
MIRFGLGVSALVVPALLVGQTPPSPARPTPASSARVAPLNPSYRGFTPGRSYQEFAERARALASRDTLRCNTSRNTAQLMECGVMIRDPQDSARFYLSAYVIEGKIAVVSMTDSGGPRLVERSRRDFLSRFGPAHRRERSMLEWKSGRRVVRLNWRGKGTARWISITLTDNDVMDGIARYIPARARRK